MGGVRLVSEDLRHELVEDARRVVKSPVPRHPVREGDAGERWDDDVEGDILPRRRLTPLRQRVEHRKKLQERAGPAMGQKYGDGVRMFRLLVEEVDLQSFDSGREVREAAIQNCQTRDDYPQLSNSGLRTHLGTPPPSSSRSRPATRSGDS